MEARLKEILWEGEAVRWTGRPQPFRLMGADSRKGIVITWIISAIVLVVTVLLLGPDLIQGSRSLSDILISTVVILFVPIILSVRPFLDKKCLEQATLYAITNYRVIAIIKGEPIYLPIGKGMQVAVEHKENGCGNLCFGEVIGKPAGKSRTLAVLGLRAPDSQNLMRGLMFYHVDQPEQLTRYFA